MARRVAIVGAGYTIPRPETPDVSYKEMMYEAACMAYKDAGIKPADVDSFVTVSEDFNEGTSIFDEYVPDQIGGMQRPVHTIAGDGILGLAAAYMQILTGAFDIVLVEGHSKASNILTPTYLLNYACDPILNRPLGLNPYYIAGLEMNRYLFETGTTKRDCAGVVVKNKKNAKSNPLAPYGANLTEDEVIKSALLFDPLSELDMSRHSDAAVVFILASETKAKKLSKRPVWLKGIGWCSGSPSLETREWGTSTSTTLAAKQAYKMAKINNPAKEIDVFEIDDTFSYKELQHMEALGLCKKGEASELLLEGKTMHDGTVPVNPSGGSLGAGLMHEATGLYKVLEIVLKLRKDCKTGLAHSWRGIPSTSSAVVVLEKGGNLL